MPSARMTQTRTENPACRPTLRTASRRSNSTVATCCSQYGLGILPRSWTLGKMNWQRTLWRRCYHVKQRGGKDTYLGTQNLCADIAVSGEATLRSSASLCFRTPRGSGANEPDVPEDRDGECRNSDERGSDNVCHPPAPIVVEVVG